MSFLAQGLAVNVRALGTDTRMAAHVVFSINESVL